MVVDTTKESVCVNKIVGQKNEEFTIEGDVIVPDIKPDLLNTINTSGNICIYKKEVLDGKVRIDGSLQIYMIYLADNEEGSVRGINTSLDFTKMVDLPNCLSGMTLSDQLKVKSIETRVLNGRKLNVKAQIGMGLKVYTNENIELINQINGSLDIQKLSNTMQVSSLVGNGSTKVYAKDTLPIDEIDQLAEILQVEFRMINKDIKLSYNKVLAKADANISILYLTEDNRINLTEGNIQVMGFIDIPDVNENHVCDPEYELKNLVIKPNMEGTRGIYIEGEVEISCSVFEKKEITVMQDLYSPTEQLDFTKKEVETMCGKENVKDIYSVREKIPMPEVAGGKIYQIQVTPYLQSQKVANDHIMYEGEIRLNMMFASNMGLLDQKNVNLPFNFSLDLPGVDSDSDVDTNIDVVKQDFVLLPDGFLDCRVDLEFTGNSSNFRSIQVIDQITSEERNREDIYSMVIYFVKPGDTLWKIAKQFGSTVDDIARVNGIENVDLLQVGRQLYIPKYSARQTA